MSDLKSIKKKLSSFANLEKLLNALNCEYIEEEQAGSLITAQLPPKFHSENRRSVQVRINDNLTCYIRTRSDFEGDIFSLISYIEHNKRDGQIQADLANAKRYICSVMGWKEFIDGTYKEKRDRTSALKSMMSGRKRKDVVPNPIIPETVLNDYEQYPIAKWEQEGITHKTQLFYQVGFDLETRRITIPCRDRFGNLVGVKGRILNNKDAPENKKYNYLHKFLVHQELFNLNNALSYILIEKRVYVFEAEKSSMMAHSFGINNCVSIGSSKVSEVQAATLRQLGLDIEIVLCFDKGLKLTEVEKAEEVFKPRRVKVLKDENNLLDHKNSPTDKGKEVFLQLVRESVDYNSN